MLYFKEKIPKDWQIESIANLIESYQQGFASGARDNNGILQLRMNNITTGGRIILDSYLKVPIPDNIDNYLLKKDDVIFNNTNSVKLIGKTAIFNDECDYCTFSNHLTRLRANRSKVSPHWLLYHFNQAWRKHYFRRICNAHVNQAGIKREDIENFKIPLPKLSEQIIIISKINNVQKLIGKINIIIDQLKILKRGLMQRLFTKGIGHTEFKDTRLGRIPKEWEITKLEDILILEYGKGLPERNRNNGLVPVVGSNGIIDYHNEYLVNEPGIVIGRKGSMGKVSLINEPFWPIDTTYFVKITNHDIVMKWLYYALTNLNLERLSLSDVVPGLNREYAYSRKISIPKLYEQEQIAKILGNIDKSIGTEKIYKEKLILAKNGLMQDLLTGKKRVKIN